MPLGLGEVWALMNRVYSYTMLAYLWKHYHSACLYKRLLRRIGDSWQHLLILYTVPTPPKKCCPFPSSIPAKCSDLVGTALISELKSARKSERSNFPDFQKGKKIVQEKVSKNKMKLRLGPRLEKMKASFPLK